MFKSAFSKYISAFMLIIILSFAVVVVITSSALGRYSKDVKEEIMQSSAEASAAYLCDRISGTSGDLTTMIEKDRNAVSETMDKILVTTEDVNLIITDTQGNVLLLSGSEETRLKEDEPISADIMEELRENGQYSKFGSFD